MIVSLPSRIMMERRWDCQWESKKWQIVCGSGGCNGCKGKASVADFAFVEFRCGFEHPPGNC